MHVAPRRLLLAALGLSLSAAGAAAEPARYVIDHEHFSASFEAMHIGYAPVIGLFREGRGSFVFDEETRELSDLEVIVDVASVFTDHEPRDGHLRSADFLSAEEHPEATFVMTDAEPTGDRTGKVMGDLTFRGVTKPITLDVTWNKSATYPYNDNYAIGLTVDTVIKRSEFGMTYALDNGWIPDEIPVRFGIEAIRQEGKTGSG